MTITTRLLLLMLAATTPVSAGSLLDPAIAAVVPGSEAFDVSRVATYEGRWQQFDRTSGAPSGSYAESLLPATVEGVRLLEHRIVTELPNGGRMITATHHDALSFAPLRIISELTGGPPDRPSKQIVAFTDGGYLQTTYGPEDQLNELSVPMSVKGFNAADLGLAIAGLPLTEGYRARLPSVMPQLKGTYWTLISVSGDTGFVLDDDTRIDAWLVDVHWLHLESGDVYPGGPEGSGGRYTIAKRIEAGHPRVLRYLTDTSDVRLVSREAGR